MAFFEEVLEKYKLNIDGLIHVGAHHGQEYQEYKQHGIDKLIFFEPQPQAFKVLEESVGDEVILHNKALGNKAGQLKMYVEEANIGMSSSLLKPKEVLNEYPEIIFTKEIMVDVVRLDDLELPYDVNTLVIDTQGYELNVLKGAQKTLDSIQYIISEVNRSELYEGGVLIETLDGFLEAHGFKRAFTEWSASWGDSLYIR